MFPKHKFILWDPAKFHPRLVDFPQIEMHNDFFTDDVAKMYHPDVFGKQVIFISDIRIVSDRYKTVNELKLRPREEVGEELDEIGEEMEENVEKDMTAQMRWHLLMNPAISMFKFRLPYSPGKTEYLDGEIRMQPWAPRTSTESRKWVLSKNGNKMITYDNTEYEERCYRLNLCVREAKYELPFRIDWSSPEVIKVLGNEGDLPQNWDLVSEMIIYNNYLRKIKGLADEDIPKHCLGMFKTLNGFFGVTLMEKYAAYEKKSAKYLQTNLEIRKRNHT
jgi:hypothetical protein